MREINKHSLRFGDAWDVVDGNSGLGLARRVQLANPFQNVATQSPFVKDFILEVHLLQLWECWRHMRLVTLGSETLGQFQ